MDEIILSYFQAWNEPDTEQRRRMLERCVTDDVELVDPTGRWKGTDAVVERISRYQSAAPGMQVVTSSGVDAHNDVARYTWKIVDQQGRQFMEGIDVAERLADGRLKRIMMFHGPFPPAEERPGVGFKPFRG